MPDNYLPNPTVNYVVPAPVPVRLHLHHADGGSHTAYVDGHAAPHPNQRADGVGFLVDQFRDGGTAPRVDSARSRLAHPVARWYGHDLLP